MSRYYQALNNNNEYVISDKYSNLILENIIKIGDLPNYSVNDEYNGGICNIDTYVNITPYLNYKYPFFCCLGTKYAGKFCVLYNSGSVMRPCSIMNSFNGICRTRSEGTRKSYSLTVGGATSVTYGWPANYTNMMSLYYDCQYDDSTAFHCPLGALPECLGTATQPVAIICDDNINGNNLNNYYVMVFSDKDKTEPKNGESAMCCYNTSGKLIFSSLDYPLVVKETVAGNAPYSAAASSKSIKIGITSSIYKSTAMPLLSNTVIGFENCVFTNHEDEHWIYEDEMWQNFYTETLNNMYYAYRNNAFGYVIFDLTAICKRYNI